MQNLKFPVCIVGAGPAGITASLFLSKYGVKHILVEQNSLPQDKVCGESFVGRVVHVLKELDLNLENELFENKIIEKSREIRGIWQPSGKKLSWKFPKSSTPFLKAKRRIFDSTLLKKAQESPFLTYRDNCHITQITPNTEGVQLIDKYKTVCIVAQIVILCVGEKIIHLSQIFPDYATDGVECLASRLYFSGAKYTDEAYASEVYFYNKPVPYILYTTRLPDNQSMIEIFISKKDAKTIDYKLEAQLKESIDQTEPLKNRFLSAALEGKAQGKSILLGTYPRKLSDNRFLLAGSSMGSIHVFTGYGVGHAMRSGQLAAYWAAKGIEQSNYSASFLKQYDKEITSRFKSDFLIGKLLVWSVIYGKFFYPISKFVFFLRMIILKIQGLLN